MICAECNRGEVFNFGVGRLKCCNCDTIYNKYDYQFDINQIMQENRAKTQELLNTICRLQQENSRLSTELIILKSK